MRSTYPIVKIDRTTITDILPIFINKGIFSNYDDLPERTDLLNKLKDDLSIEALTFEQEREQLSQIGEYKTDDYVVRDYGSYLIAFTLNAYQGNLNDDLRRVRLNQRGHKIAIMILSEVYSQRKWEGLVIPKQKIVECLGYTSHDKHIYRDISDVMYSLRWLDYKIIEYKTKVKIREDKKTTGNFIYNLSEDSRSFTLWVNPLFVGSVAYVLSCDKSTLPNEAFKRGYFSYPTSLLPLSKNYSQGAYLLTNFLMTEKGNSKLNIKDYKVIAYKIPKYMEVMKLNYRRADKNYRAYLRGLEEIQIIDRVDPDISTLKRLKPSKIKDQVVRIYVKKETDQLDDEIKKYSLGDKIGEKVFIG